MPAKKRVIVVNDNSTDRQRQIIGPFLLQNMNFVQQVTPNPSHCPYAGQ